LGPFVRLGFRNLGRNRRRTLITAVGLGAGYFAVVFMVGLADGIKAEMIASGTGLLSGQIQIHSLDYRPERSLYETIGGDQGTDVGALVREVSSDPAVAAAAPRVYGAGLLSSGDSTSAGMLLGIDPTLESNVSRILTGITEGRPPAMDANELLIGAEMARQLKVAVGAEVVVVAPAADGSMGNDVFTVSGVFRTGLAELDAAYALVPLGVLQRLVALDSGRVHEIALKTRDPWLAPEASGRIRKALGPKGLAIEVEPWTRLRPEMLDYVRLLESWYFIIMAIVFGIAIFGVANILLMATFERRREFAVMLALGTTPLQVVAAVLWEAIALGVMSLLAGALLTFPVIVWWHEAPPDFSFLYGDFTMLGALMRPVLRVEYNPLVWLQTAGALLLTALLAAAYPAASASRSPPADTLSGL
jgi:ABC-type lipoprotein release transport system permease subunit